MNGGLAPASTVSLQTRGSRSFYSIVFPFSQFHFPFAARPVSPSSPLLSLLSENRTRLRKPAYL